PARCLAENALSDSSQFPVARGAFALVPPMKPYSAVVQAARPLWSRRRAQELRFRSRRPAASGGDLESTPLIGPLDWRRQYEEVRPPRSFRRAPRRTPTPRA